MKVRALVYEKRWKIQISDYKNKEWERWDLNICPVSILEGSQIKGWLQGKLLSSLYSSTLQLLEASMLARLHHVPTQLPLTKRIIY